MREFSLNNVEEITIKDGIVEILYQDGVTHTIKEDIKLIRNLTNVVISPNPDHCI